MFCRVKLVIKSYIFVYLLLIFRGLSIAEQYTMIDGFEYEIVGYSGSYESALAYCWHIPGGELLMIKHPSLAEKLKRWLIQQRDTCKFDESAKRIEYGLLNLKTDMYH